MHDGSAGIISTSVINGASGYSPVKFATAGQTRLTIFENGYVDINITGTPTVELTVGGKIYAKEVKVDVNAGQVPDYVFLSNYRLRQINEVLRFINEPRHFADVPSAEFYWRLLKSRRFSV